MKENELRIGNLVYAIRYRDDSGDFYPTVVKSLSDGWGVENGKNVYSTNINKQFYESGSEWGFTVGDESECKPIPLTEEWKDKIRDNEYIRIDMIGFIIYSNGHQYHFSVNDYPYLHLIQNLYSALTNEELIIK
tara:strand:- start:36 stop:437 length:402 start_codon:yes stop_codon:yes gene_type:complete